MEPERFSNLFMLSIQNWLVETNISAENVLQEFCKKKNHITLQVT